jgi:hypothetical protein
MSAKAVKERISIKDIQKITGFKKTKSERLYKTLRLAKQRQLNIELKEEVALSEVHIFIDDLAKRIGLSREVILERLKA